MGSGSIIPSVTAGMRRSVVAAVHNDDIARIFDHLADLLEIDAANPFRIRAYRNAARFLRDLPRELSELVDEGEDLSKLPTIGKDLANKIQEIVLTGQLKMLTELERRLPGGLGELTRVPGLGPKRVKLLFDELGLETADELRAAAQAHELRELPGIGAKIEESIVAYFANDRSQEHRTKIYDAEKTANRVIDHLSAVADRADISVAGSYRRRAETVGDLDVLVASASAQKVMDHFALFPDIAHVDAQGKTRATVHLRSGLQIDLRVVAKASYGAALVYFTGSKFHNIALRKRAMSRGLKINEYGIFKGTDRIGGRTERDVYAAIGLPYIAPELREARGEIEAAARKQLPNLIEVTDISGDLHVHSNASDGQNSIREMALAAKMHGYAYLAITDHTKHTRIAHGLDIKRLERQLDEIDRLNDELKDIRILKSAEVDILADGSLDLPDDVLAKLDLSVCAIHFDLNLTVEKQTARIIRAMDHPAFSILAHPTCRLIGERDPMRVDVERLLDAAAVRGCFLELNGQPERLDLNDVYCRMAKERGLKLALSTDAHSTDQLNFMRLAVGQARRAWIERDDVINAQSWRELKRLLAR